MFSKVTITASVAEYLFDRLESIRRGEGLRGFRHAETALYEAAKEKMWKHAELWANMLVQNRDGGKATCTATEEEIIEHWTGYTCFKTIEAVNHETGPTISLAADPYPTRGTSDLTIPRKRYPTRRVFWATWRLKAPVGLGCFTSL